MQLKYFLVSALLLGGVQVANAQGSNWKSVADHLTVHAWGQLVYSAQEQDGKWTNGYDLRRLYTVVSAQFTDRVSMTLHYDFQRIHELYGVVKLKKNGALNIKVGQYKSPLTYENSVSPFTIENIAVGTQAMSYLVGGAEPLFGLNYGRDMGFMLTGDLPKLHYELSIQNGCGINKRDNNNYKDVVARVDFKPTDQWIISLSGQKGRGCAQAESPYNPDIKVGEDYLRDRVAVGARYTQRGFILRGEYIAGKDGTVSSNGWVVASTIPVAKKWEAIAICDYLNKNPDLKATETDVLLGATWKFHPMCRLQLEYIHTFPNENWGQPKNVLQTQLQLGF